MKIKPGYVIKEVSERFIVVPTGQEAINFKGIITLNKSGKILFEALQNESTVSKLIQLLLDTFDVGVEQATRDVEQFVVTLENNHLLV